MWKHGTDVFQIWAFETKESERRKNPRTYFASELEKIAKSQRYKETWAHGIDDARSEDSILAKTFRLPVASACSFVERGTAGAARELGPRDP